MSTRVIHTSSAVACFRVVGMNRKYTNHLGTEALGLCQCMMYETLVTYFTVPVGLCIYLYIHIHIYDDRCIE